MATRRLTDAFLLLRNNAIQSRQLLAEQELDELKEKISSLGALISTIPGQFLSEDEGGWNSDPHYSESAVSDNMHKLVQELVPGVRPATFGWHKSHHKAHLDHTRSQLADDRMALVSGISLDPEAAICVTKRLPPKWVDGVDEIQYEISRIKLKMKELASLHDKHLNRPTLDDSSEEEHAIEITTQEITQLFHRCQRAVQALQSRSRSCTEQEQRLLKNVVSSLAQSLQDLSISFRHGQSDYLKRMKNREERSKHFFGTSVPLMDDGEDTTLYDRGFTDDQLVLVEQNTLLVEEREREVRQIVQSISDLNEIFRDLGSMVVEQGTVLDRIDYNVEQSCVKTEEGLKQLHKAEQYQKKNRKMLVILILFVVVIVLIVVLIGVKFR